MGNMAIYGDRLPSLRASTSPQEHADPLPDPSRNDSAPMRDRASLHGPDREPGLAGGDLDLLGRDGAGAQDLPRTPFGLAALGASHTTWVVGSLGRRGSVRASSECRLALSLALPGDLTSGRCAQAKSEVRQPLDRLVEIPIRGADVRRRIQERTAPRIDRVAPVDLGELKNIFPRADVVGVVHHFDAPFRCVTQDVEQSGVVGKLESRRVQDPARIEQAPGVVL